MNNLIPPSFNTLKKLIATLFLVLFALPFCEVNILTKNSQPFAIGVKSPSAIEAKNTLQTTYGWSIQRFERNTKQSNLQIKVSSSQTQIDTNSTDYWNSGKSRLTQSVQVPYGSKPMTSASTFFWRVKIWCKGKASKWSVVGTFHTNLKDNLENPSKVSDWKVKWIKLDSLFPWDRNEFHSQLSAPSFRKKFNLTHEIKYMALDLKPYFPKELNQYMSPINLLEA